MRASCFIAIGLLGLLLLSASVQAEEPDNPFERGDFRGLWVLSFNRGGELVSPLELALAIDELTDAKDRVDRIIIFSYGWAYDGEASYATYVDTLKKMTSYDTPRSGNKLTAVIAVGWDSSTSGFRKFFNDLIPLPVVADTLAWLPDKLFFPVSFWSKASQADRIGYGGLRTALNEILTAVYPEPEPRPDIYLVGHSFGARIVSGLMREKIATLPVQGERFVGTESVAGAVLYQPALVPANLDRDPHYPILITQSRHDHANGFLYPIANALINSYAYTTFEAFADSSILSPIQGGIEKAVGTVGDVVTYPLPDRPQQQAEPDEEGEPGLPRRALARVRRGLSELVSIPITFVFTLVSLPVGYAYVQTRELLTHPIDHVMDTLAQIPVVEAPVWALDELLGREVHWGSRGKGFFTIGSLNEAAGRAAAPGPFARTVYPVYSLIELKRLSAESDCGLPVCQGPFAVDASSIARTGAFGEDLENPLYDFTIGWLDLVGAHGDYRNEAMVDLLQYVVRETERDESGD